MEKKKRGRIQKAVLLRTVIPMIIMGIVIACVAFYGYKKSIREEIEKSLAAVAASVASVYDEVYPGDYTLVGDEFVAIYKGETNITGEYDIVDRIKSETGIDVTLFYGNTRILTTLKDENGARYIQTGINAGAYDKICKASDAECFQVLIDGENYYACYLPLYNSDETFAGIVATAVKETEIDNLAVKSAMPIMLITLIAAVLTGFISYSYTNNMADSILKVRKFLKGMTDGNLDNEMPKEVIARDDELADAGKAMIDMQNAIRGLVERDPLTSLYNRRYGGARLKNLQVKAARNGMPYSVCICDIDFFKSVNDTYGHDAGDIVLKRVADILRKAMTGKGFVVRWGGEEFLLIFDKNGINDAERILNEIRLSIQNTEIVYGRLVIRITMSFGVVNGDDTNGYGALLNHADERLYYAKSHGRNRVVATDNESILEKQTAEINNSKEQKSESDASSVEEKTSDDNNEAIVEGMSSSDRFTLEESEFLTKLLDKMNEQLYAKMEEDQE